MASDFDENALANWLAANVPSAGAVTGVEKFAGGQSNPTYRVRTTAGDLVLRRKPFGQLLASAHSVDREFRVISALQPTGFPVPRPIALCTDDSVIGSIFYLMEMIDGRTFWDGDLPEIEPGDRCRVYEKLVDTLAQLHNIQPEAVGLADYGRPGNYFARQVERWTRQYRAAQTEDEPRVDGLIQFLSDTVPPQQRTTIIHGDYRIDNLIFDHEGVRPVAVLDWELSTLGDPMADFAYLSLNWLMPHTLSRASIGGLDLVQLGIPSLDEMTERYCAASGIAKPSQLNWYFAFSLFRSIGIAQGVKKRWLDGNAAGENASVVSNALPRLIEGALDFADRARATTY